MNSRKLNPRLISLLELMCVLGVHLATSPVAAQSASNKAAAEALFEQGRQLMQSGEHAKACEKFEASRNLDEGIGTLLYLADCYERVGRTASAWAMFKEAASVAGAQGQESRQKVAAQRAKNLEPALVKLTIEVAKANESLLGFELRNNGVPVPAAQFGALVPVDPGEHRIEASAPGKRSYVEVVQMSKGSGRVVVPPLTDVEKGSSSMPDAPNSDPAARPPLATPTSATTGSDTANSTRADSRPTNTLQRGVAYALGGVGLVGIGIGSYFGLSAIDKNSESKQECPSNSGLCSPAGVEMRNDALSSARVSTIAFAAGGAALATGLVLYFTAPRGHATEVALSPAFGTGHSQLSFRGRF